MNSYNKATETQQKVIRKTRKQGCVKEIYGGRSAQVNDRESPNSHWDTAAKLRSFTIDNDQCFVSVVFILVNNRTAKDAAGRRF